MTAELCFIACILAWCGYLHWTLRDLRRLYREHDMLISDHDHTLVGFQKSFRR